VSSRSNDLSNAREASVSTKWMNRFSTNRRPWHPAPRQFGRDQPESRCRHGDVRRGFHASPSKIILCLHGCRSSAPSRGFR
jgi:hypothetical protein